MVLDFFGLCIEYNLKLSQTCLNQYLTFKEVKWNKGKNVKEKYDHNLNRRINFQDRLGHKMMKYLNSKQTKCLLRRH